MYCKNCGANLSVDDKFCKNCETSINSRNIQDNKSNNQVVQTDFDETFIKAYIGAKADKMYESVKNGGINIWSIIFGIGYFAYRKMYLVSILIVIIGGIISYIFPFIGSFVGMIIGFMFCPLYKWDITRKLRNIKNENPTANETQLLEIAKNRGGTSIAGAIMFFVIYFIIIIFI